MKNTIVFLVLLLTALSCGEIIGDSSCEDHYFDEANDIFYDKVKDSTVREYSSDNIVYPPHKQQIFSISCADSTGRPVYFNFDPNAAFQSAEQWAYSDSKNINSIELVRMTVQEGLGINSEDEDYTQSVITYNFINFAKFIINISGTTGLVENCKNIWLHPPRVGSMKILEITPFPYVVHPIRVGNSYSTNLKIGGYWSTEIVAWSGSIDNQCVYEISSKGEFVVGDKVYAGYYIEAKASSSVSIVQSTFFYSPTEGFIYHKHNINDRFFIELKLVDKENII